jgi:serine/threonine protein kinase
LAAAAACAQVSSNFRVKLSDFGFARKLAMEPILRMSIRGTEVWRAPEVIMGENSDQRADIFSLGVVFWELMARRDGRDFHRVVDEGFSLDFQQILKNFIAEDAPPGTLSLSLSHTHTHSYSLRPWRVSDGRVRVWSPKVGSGWRGTAAVSTPPPDPLAASSWRAWTRSHRPTAVRAPSSLSSISHASVSFSFLFLSLCRYNQPRTT